MTYTLPASSRWVGARYRASTDRTACTVSYGQTVVRIFAWAISIFIFIIKAGAVTVGVLTFPIIVEAIATNRRR